MAATLNTLARLGLLGTALVLAVMCYRDAALAYWRSQPPQDVPARFADDPAIAVIRAEAVLLNPTQTGLNLPAIEANAVRELRKNPLDASAMFELGLVRKRLGVSSGRKEFLLAERISRREIANQLVLLDLANRDRNITDTLHHIDRILSLAPNYSDTLDRALASALSDDKVRKATLGYASRPWFPGLIGAAIDAGLAQPYILSMLRALPPDAPVNVSDDLYRRLLAHTITARDYQGVQTLLAHLPSVNPAALGSMGFAPATTDPRFAPLAWSLVSDDLKSARLDAPDRLVVNIAAEQTGSVAERMTILQPGSYELTQIVSYDALSPQASLTWEVSCAGPAAQTIWHQSVPARGGEATYRSTIIVPEGCAAQQWHLVATGVLGQVPSQVTLRVASLVRK